MRNLGLMGKMGSGKGFAAKYLAKKYHYRIISMGNFVRALARKEKIKPTRENLEKLQKKYSRSGDYVMDKVLEKAESMKGPVLLDGIRKPLQAGLAKKRLKAFLIDIGASEAIRFSRMKRRGREGFSKTLKEFREIEMKEERVFHINRALKMADFKVNNDDGKPRLYRDLDRIIRKVNR